MVNNRQTITVGLYPLPFEIETRVFLVMISFFLFGMFFALLAFSKNLLSNAIARFRDKIKINKLQKRVEKK